MTLMVSVPMGSVETVRLAVLVLPVAPGTRIAVPNSTEEAVGGNNSAKVTVPVGGAKLPVKVAVKITGWPKGEGFGAPVRVAVLVSCSTVIVTVGEVEGAWVESPE